MTVIFNGMRRALMNVVARRALIEMNDIIEMTEIGVTRSRHADAVNRSARAQTMTEYALILGAVAIAVYLTYQVMGQDIGSMVSALDSARLNA